MAKIRKELKRTTELIEGNDLGFRESLPLDVLSQVLRSIRLYASSYFCVDFSAPWGIVEKQTEYGIFHAIINGEAWLELPGKDDPIHLAAGDIVAFPSGKPHSISDRPGASLMQGRSVLDLVRTDKNPFFTGQISVTLLCGYFKYQKQTRLPLLRDMPSLLHIQSGTDQDMVWLNNLVNRLAYESRTMHPGSAVLIDRLTEIFVIELLRCHMNNQQKAKGYFLALTDDRLSKAISLLHRHPSHSWTVENLGSAVSMSRSAFANHFQSVVGVTPMAYLTQWRMIIACDLLVESNDSMQMIAERVGYKSEASFGKAFKKVMGTPPGQIRKKIQRTIV